MSIKSIENSWWITLNYLSINCAPYGSISEKECLDAVKKVENDLSQSFESIIEDGFLPHSTVLYLEGGLLVEYFFEQNSDHGLVANLLVKRISDDLPYRSTKSGFKSYFESNVHFASAS